MAARTRLRRALGRLGGGAERATAARLDRIERIAARIELRVEHELTPAVERMRTVESIAATTATVAALPPSDTLVSVVMPTRDRVAMVADAVASVQAQSHSVWELLVVDDGSVDGTPGVLAELAAADPRVRVLRQEGDGPEVARNCALDQARGELVAYLDDDNAMCPHWLRAVAWTFAERPDADVAYGARAIDVAGEVAPWIQFEPWSRERLRIFNFVDQNVIAHRAGLAEARFDERMRTASDWDLALRLTADRPPLRIPLLAAVYRAAASGRMAHVPGVDEHRLELQRDLLRRWPLRLLVLDLVADGAGTAAVARELAALRAVGLTAAACGDHPAPPDIDDFHHGLEPAVRAFDPTAIAVLGVAPEDIQLERIVRQGRPFYLRDTHSGDPAAALGHPSCAGAFGPPGPDFAARLVAALDGPRAALAELPPPS